VQQFATRITRLQGLTTSPQTIIPAGTRVRVLGMIIAGTHLGGPFDICTFTDASGTVLFTLMAPSTDTDFYRIPFLIENGLRVQGIFNQPTTISIFHTNEGS
jgi:hypothetical protein